MENKSLAREILDALSSAQTDDRVIGSEFRELINAEYDNRSIIVEPYDIVNAVADACIEIMSRIGAIDNESTMNAAEKFFFEIAMTMTKLLFSEEE